MDTWVLLGCGFGLGLLIAIWGIWSLKYREHAYVFATTFAGALPRARRPCYPSPSALAPRHVPQDALDCPDGTMPLLPENPR